MNEQLLTFYKSLLSFGHQSNDLNITDQEGQGGRGGHGFAELLFTWAVCRNCRDVLLRRRRGDVLWRHRRCRLGRTKRDDSGSQKRARSSNRIPTFRKLYHWPDSRSIYSFSILILKLKRKWRERWTFLLRQRFGKDKTHLCLQQLKNAWYRYNIV